MTLHLLKYNLMSGCNSTIISTICKHIESNKPFLLRLKATKLIVLLDFQHIYSIWLITDNGALGCLSYDEDTGRFEAAAFAPSATINACRNIRKFVALDACHTKSKYPMMLMIAVGID